VFGDMSTYQGFFYGVFLMKNNNLQKTQSHLFNFGNASIRAQVDAVGVPWFNANDVCNALDLTNPHKAVGDHVDGDDLQKLEVIDNLGRTQRANHINESGLYTLIFGSAKPEAKKFKRWVTREVLPSIRQTGEYVNADLKAKIAALRSNNEDLEHENRDMQATLRNMGVTYQQLYTIEHAILQHITNDPGKHSSAALEYLVHRDVKCTNSDYWHAMSDLYNRYKIRQNRAGFWELAR
jgi:prophage antirepressor-like protein